MTDAITLASWFLIFGAWFVIGLALAIVIGMVLRGREPEEDWSRDTLMREGMVRNGMDPSKSLEANLYNNPGPYWQEPDLLATWEFPNRHRPYDQERG
jgi:hypothetical protein